MRFKLLRKIPFLRKLSAKDLKRVYHIAKERVFKEGEAIFGKSEAAEHMFIVISGRVKIFTNSATKKRKTFAYLSPGDFFGEMALLEGGPRSASAQAVVDSKLLVVSKTDFRRLLIKDPKLTYYLLRIVSERLRRANQEIEGLLFHNILGRVAKALSDLSRDGKNFRGGMLLKEHFTQQELADLVGTTREPLTRALAALRRAELIEFHHGRYFIKNVERLSTLSLISA